MPSPFCCTILFNSTITALWFWPKTEAKTAVTRKQEYTGEEHRGPVRLEEWEAKSRAEWIFQGLSAIACRIYQYEYFVWTSRKHSLSSQRSLFSVQAFSNSWRGITRDISSGTAHSGDLSNSTFQRPCQSFASLWRCCWKQNDIKYPKEYKLMLFRYFNELWN